MIDEAGLLDQDAVFSVGRVVAVKGRHVHIAVSKQKNSSHLLFKGQVVRNVAVGSYIKIAKGFVELVASVDGEHIEEDRSPSHNYRRPEDSLSRQLQVSLIGYFECGKFIRGVRELPLLDNECFILTESEFHSIHDFVSAEDTGLSLGTLAFEPTQSVEVGVNTIFASHVGIFGNTGSGKSYTLAKLYHELFRKFSGKASFRKKARFVVIDFNGEYINIATAEGAHSTAILAGSDIKKEYRLSTRGEGDRLPMPKAVITDTTFWAVLLDATEKTQAPFLSRVLESDYWNRQMAQPADLLVTLANLVIRATASSDITVDRQTSVNLLDEIRRCLGDAAPETLKDLIEEFRQNLHFHSVQRKFYWGASSNGAIYQDNEKFEPTIRSKFENLSIDFDKVDDGIDLIRLKIVLQFYSDTISGFANREHLSPLIKRLERRVPAIKRLIEIAEDDAEQIQLPLTVVSLRDVNLDMRKVVPMLLCKYLYDHKKASDGNNRYYLNIIIDEAHNILSTESTRESEVWRDYRLETFEEIIKEGRKFGVFVTIASQRPHDISPTIISQLHNYFLHRLVNSLDIAAVERAVSYLDRVSFESLPILPTGTCIIAGVSTQVPIVVQVASLPFEAEPNSRTLKVSEDWLSEELESQESAPSATEDLIPSSSIDRDR